MKFSLNKVFTLLKYNHYGEKRNWWNKSKGQAPRKQFQCLQKCLPLMMQLVFV